MQFRFFAMDPMGKLREDFEDEGVNLVSYLSTFFCDRSRSLHYSVLTAEQSAEAAIWLLQYVFTMHPDTKCTPLLLKATRSWASRSKKTPWLTRRFHQSRFQRMVKRVHFAVNPVPVHNTYHFSLRQLPKLLAKASKRKGITDLSTQHRFNTDFLHHFRLVAQVQRAWEAYVARANHGKNVDTLGVLRATNSRPRVNPGRRRPNVPKVMTLTTCCRPDFQTGVGSCWGGNSFLFWG